MNAYDESGITQTVPFCYGSLSSELNEAFDESREAIQAACECNRRVWQWVYQPPNQDLDGFICRCIVACWVFVPQLREYSQTAIAARFGKKKQSLNRWIVDFKREFPEIGQHLQHTR